MTRVQEKNNDVCVQDPPIPLGGQYFDNCYHDPVPNVFQKTLKPLNGQGINKGTQKGGPFDGDLHRKDAKLVTADNVETDVSESTISRTKGKAQQKGGRGRKN